MTTTDPKPHYYMLDPNGRPICRITKRQYDAQLAQRAEWTHVMEAIEASFAAILTEEAEAP